MKALRVSLPLATVTCLLPSLAMAHPGHAGLADWATGFGHPFQGLDHIVAMVAVGFWAAHQQQTGKWMLPAVFLLAMTGGGIAGTYGVGLPGAEVGIGLSVLVLGALAVTRAKMKMPWAAATVGLFAVFHGYAHGSEMPEAAGLLTYGLGFLLATALLHGVGFVLSCVAAHISARVRAATPGMPG